METKTKSVYRQSNLVHLFDCPRKYQLSTKYDRKQTPAMMDGIFFESLVLGQKPDQVVDAPKKRASTIESYERIVEHVKSVFVEGLPYRRYKHETEDWILQGEADFVGEVMFCGEKIRCIADLKFTSSIDKIWQEKTHKKEFLQSAVYQYLHLKETGEQLPFVYFVVENIKDLPADAQPIMAPYMIEIIDERFLIEWVEALIKRAHPNQIFDVNPLACFSGPFGTRCPYFLYCQPGRHQIEYGCRFSFEDLMD